jgi:hypothetical protein
MKTALIFCVLLLLLGVVGTMDYNDQVADTEHYNAMVCNKYWPDYKSLKPTCN